MVTALQAHHVMQAAGFEIRPGQGHVRLRRPIGVDGTHVFTDDISTLDALELAKALRGACLIADANQAAVDAERAAQLAATARVDCPACKPHPCTTWVTPSDAADELEMDRAFVFDHFTTLVDGARIVCADYLKYLIVIGTDPIS